MGVLLDVQLGVTLLFFGGGGQVRSSGILNLLPFGVEHPLEQTYSSSSSFSTILILLKPPSCLEVAVEAEAKGLAIILWCFVAEAGAMCYILLLSWYC